MYKKYLERVNESLIPPNLFGYNLIDVPDDKTYRTIDWEKLKNNVQQFINRANSRINSSEEIRTLLGKYYKDLPEKTIILDSSPLNDGALKTRFTNCADITLDIMFFKNNKQPSGSRISHVSFHSPEPIYTHDKGCIPWPKSGKSLAPGTAGLHYIVHSFIDNPELKIDKKIEPTIRFVPNHNVKDGFEFVTQTTDISEYEKNKVELYSTPECIQTIANHETYKATIEKMISTNNENKNQIGPLTQTINEMLETSYTSKETNESVKLSMIVKQYIVYLNPKFPLSIVKDNIMLMTNYDDKQKKPRKDVEFKTINEYLYAKYIVTSETPNVHEMFTNFLSKYNDINNFDKNLEKFTKSNEKVVTDYKACINEIANRTLLIHNNYKPYTAETAYDGYLLHDYLYKSIAETLNSMVKDKTITYDQPVQGGFSKTRRRANRPKKKKTHKRTNKKNKLRKSCKK
jgi:hypothetical protein